MFKKISILFSITLVIVYTSFNLSAISIRSAASERSATTSNRSAVATAVEEEQKAMAIDTDCQTRYNSCMDNFCASGDKNAKRCICLNKHASIMTRIDNVEKNNINIADQKNRDIQNIQLGAQAGIVEDEMSKYNQEAEKESNSNSSKSIVSDLMALMMDPTGDSYSDEDDELVNARGAKLFNMGNQECEKILYGGCEHDWEMITQNYVKYMKDDCRRFGKYAEGLESKLKISSWAAKQEVETARFDSFKSSNLYSKGECMVRFNDCMRGDKVCKSDFSECFPYDDSPAIDFATTLVKVNATLSNKQLQCERVLDECVNVSDEIYGLFIAFIKPDIEKIKERRDVEFRQTCVEKSIECIYDVCDTKDSLGDDSKEMEMCLRDSAIAKGGCSHILNPCNKLFAVGEGADPNIVWTTLKWKLNTMTNKACQEEMTAKIEKSCEGEVCISTSFDDFMNRPGQESAQRFVCGGIEDDVENEFSSADVSKAIKNTYEEVQMYACFDIIDDLIAEYCDLDITTGKCKKFSSYKDIQSMTLVGAEGKDINTVYDEVKTSISSPTEGGTDGLSKLVGSEVDNIIAKLVNNSRYASCNEGLKQNSIVGTGSYDFEDKVRTVLEVFVLSDAKVQYNNKKLKLYADLAKKLDVAGKKTACDANKNGCARAECKRAVTFDTAKYICTITDNYCSAYRTKRVGKWYRRKNVRYCHSRATTVLPLQY
ncbi:MAG: hypothetical protein JJV93_02990 [Alphaproteobacteria bacterium]|nr:hypothetical protein [Alphaproteobacteria bacterium]